MAKILVADDDTGIVDAMKILLEGEGHDVIITTDGNNIEQMYGHKPDLVFLDIWMSGINGNVVCQRLKENSETSHIPIVMFSANRDTEQIALQSGANDFLSKPFEIKDLIAMVNKHV